MEDDRLDVEKTEEKQERRKQDGFDGDRLLFATLFYFLIFKYLMWV